MQFERKCLNHYNQGVRDNSSAAEPSSASWKSVAKILVSNWVCGIQMTTHLLPSLPFSPNKGNPFYPSASTASLSLDVTDPNAHSLITSSGATICKPTSFPCVAFLSLLEASCTSFHQWFLFAVPNLPCATCCSHCDQPWVATGTPVVPHRLPQGTWTQQGHCDGTGSVNFQV